MAENQRKTPTLREIIKHWHAVDELPSARFRTIGLGEPSCFRCGWLPPVPDITGYGPVATPEGFEEWTADRRLAYSWRAAGRYLDRAHLVDWSATHDDSPTNVVLLCHYPCHSRMPTFIAGQRIEALTWVQEHPGRSPWWQVFTDAQAAHGVLTDRHQLKPLYIEFLETASEGGGRSDA